MDSKWKRRQWTTRCSDPTTVVEWSNGVTTVTEFQGVYMTKVGTIEQAGGQGLHQSLESKWQEEQGW